MHHESRKGHLAAAGMQPQGQPGVHQDVPTMDGATDAYMGSACSCIRGMAGSAVATGTMAEHPPIGITAWCSWQRSATVKLPRGRAGKAPLLSIRMKYMNSMHNCDWPRAMPLNSVRAPSRGLCSAQLGT